MGCWNSGCAVTGLTIEYGDPVVLIPFINKGSENYPIMLPVHGTYNDYGTIENIKYNDSIKKLEQTILNKSFLFCDVTDPDTGESVVITEENKYDDFNDMVPKDKTGIWFGREYTTRCKATLPTNLEEFFNAVERQMCFGKYDHNVVHISDFSHEWKQLGFVLVHEEVYNWLISTDQYDTQFRTLEDYNEKIDSIPDEFFDKTINGDYELASKSIRAISSIFENIREDYYSCGAPTGYDCKSKDELREYAKLVYEYFTFRMMFKFLRKSYAPDIYAGSQSENLNAIKKLNSFTNKFIPSLKKTRKVRYDG